MKQDAKTGPLLPMIVTAVIIALFVGAGLLIGGSIGELPFFGKYERIRTQLEWDGMHDTFHRQYAEGRHEAAVTTISQALEFSRRTFGEEHKNTLVSMADLTEGLMAVHDYVRAENLAMQALAVNEVVYGEGSYYAIRLRRDLGKISFFRGDHEKALGRLRDLVRILEESGGDPEDLVESLDWMTVVYATEARWEEAIPVYERILTLCGQDEELVHEKLEALCDLSWTLGASGDADGSRDRFEEALGFAEDRFGRASNEYAGVHLDRGKYFLSREQYTEAEEHMVRSMRILQAAKRDCCPGLAEATRALAELYDETGRTAKARELRADGRVR